MTVAADAAYRAGHRLQRYFRAPCGVTRKGIRDLLTEADTAAEEVIGETIAKAFPEHSILAEESGLNHGDGRYRWIIDPLDGTINFAHGIEIFAVSIAFQLDGKSVVGVVLNPATGERFSAMAGRGAWLNDHPIGVSAVERMADSFLATGLIFDTDECLSRLMARFRTCSAAALGIRRLGSAALDLCFLACGRFDGYWEENLKPWDTAAGALIAAEAGAMLSDFSNQPYHVEKKEILATNGRIHQQLLALLQH